MATPYVQLTVQNTAAMGAPGLVGDSWFGTEIMTFAAGSDGYAGTEGGIKPGYAVASGSTQTVNYPTAAGSVTAPAGIVVANPALESLDPLYAEGTAVSVLKKGRVWVVFEDAESATVGSSPYVRTSGVGHPGAFKSTASNATQATWAKIVTVDTLYGRVELDVLLPVNG